MRWSGVSHSLGRRSFARSFFTYYYFLWDLTPNTLLAVHYTQLRTIYALRTVSLYPSVYYYSSLFRPVPILQRKCINKKVS